MLNKLSFKLSNTELICLIGPPGCGKTTLFNIIAGLDNHFEGAFIINSGRHVVPPVMFFNHLDDYPSEPY